MTNSRSIEDLINDLKNKKQLAKLGGGKEKIEIQHKKGKLTARERLELLLDDNSFVETDPLVLHRSIEFGMDKKKFYGDGVVTGYGTINGRPVFVFAHDFTVFGGSWGEMFTKKILKIMDLALKTGAPVIGLNDSGGARIQEGVISLAGVGDIFYQNVRASGVIPQISIMLGPSAGGAVYSPALTDFVIMVKGTSYMFITGPKVTKEVTGEDVTFEDLGGAEVHASKSGVAHFIVNSEEEAIYLVKKLLSYLPQNNMQDPPIIDTKDDPERRDEELNYMVPTDPSMGYEVRDIISRVIDLGSFFEVHQHYAPNIVVGFGRLNGKSVGIVANQPRVLAGALDIDASIKAARFVRFCDAFNIPIITFVDVPGYLPGVDQEHGGIIKHGAKLLFAYSEASVPKITIILRKAYGGAYIVMGSRHMGADQVFAWPTAEIAVMGAKGAVSILYGKEIKKAQNPEEFIKKKMKEYERAFSNPYRAAEMGFVDDVIEPSETRPRIIKALETILSKRETQPPKKHGNIPL